VTAEHESPGHVNTQPVVVPTERHLALYQLLRSTSRHDRNGDLVSWWPQAKLAAKLGCSVRTLQNVLADLREPGIDPRHPRQAAGLRLGLVRVVPTTYRDKASGRHRLGGNAYVIVAGQHATLQKPVSPAHVNTQESGVACLNEKAPADGGHQGVDEDEHARAAASIELAAVLDVGHQHEPSWADQRLDADQMLDRLRGQLGDVKALGMVANDDPERDARLRALHTDGTPPAKPRWSNRRPSYRPAGKDTRRLPLTRDLDDFHAAVDALNDDTVPESYYLKVTANRRRPAR
jgi:hypothetical protein